MKIILLGVAATSFVVGAPAAAQSSNSERQYRDSQYRDGQDRDSQYRDRDRQGVDSGSDSGDISARIDQLETRIQSGVQSGSISRSEAVPLRQQFRQLTALETRYSSSGFTSAERADLQDDMRDLRQQIRVAEGGAQGSSDRYGDRGLDERDRSTSSDNVRKDREPAERRSIGSIVDGVIGQPKRD